MTSPRSIWDPDYDASKDAHDSYFVAVEAKRQRGDTAWPSRSVVIELLWPKRVLHPNARPHWAERAREAKKARIAAAWAAKAAKADFRGATALNVTVTFTPPTNHAQDTDGMLAACKAYFDGIADVIGVDDSKWTFIPKRAAPKKPGSVRLEIEATGGPMELPLG